MTLTFHTVGPDVWLKRPKLAVHIANITQMWNLIEFELALIFVLLTGTNRTVLGAMFSDIISIPTRLDMLNKLIKAGVNENGQGEFEELYKRIRKLSRRRAACVHGLWATHDERPVSVFLVDMWPFSGSCFKQIEYKEGTFLTIEQALKTLRHDLFLFRQSLLGRER